MAPHGLRPVDFSVLTLVACNPGITSRQICATLAIQPPNLVGLVGSLQQRGLIERRPHPNDGRAVGLHLTPAGADLHAAACATASAAEAQAAIPLTAREQDTLVRLLRKLYRDD
jgi:DNA-binding MarR family transcriptional regulator